MKLFYKNKMKKSVLSYARLMHRKIASVLFVFFLFIAISGIMLGWKSVFTETIFENKQLKGETSLKKWLPLDSLESMAIRALNEKTNNKFEHAKGIQIKPSKGYISFSFKNNYAIQIDGATGATICIEHKNAEFIQDIHDGALIDELINSKMGVSKKIYTTLMGLALLMLTLSGFWMWFKPKQMKQSKKQ
jgi:uncharacterized iron-regulated membrane protein